MLRGALQFRHGPRHAARQPHAESVGRRRNAPGVHAPVAFTDGVTEPENEAVEFGEERLIERVREHRREPLSRIGDAITGAVAAWIGDAEQPDDVTVVLARAR